MWPDVVGRSTMLFKTARTFFLERLISGVERVRLLDFSGAEGALRLEPAIVKKKRGNGSFICK